jgi:uncharacterized RmlC-like cupin family protein
MALPIREVTKEEMLKRVAIFKDLVPSKVPLIDAVLPEFQREIFSIIGGGVMEDAQVVPPITAVEGFHLSIVKCGAGKGTGLHNHRTVEVFIPLTGRWSIHWGSNAENEVILGPYDVASVPISVMRGFRNVSDEEGLLLVVVGGTDPGQVEWTGDVLSAVQKKGFGFNEDGKITNLRPALHDN